MNDLISKSTLMESLIHCEGLGRKSCELVATTIKNQPIVSEQEIRNKAIEDFSQEAVEQFTKFDLEHGYPTVADCKIILQEIAERMKEVGE